LLAIFIANFSSSHLAVLRRAKKLQQLVHALDATTTEILSGDEVATPLASFQLGSIITGFPRSSEG